MTEQHPLTEAQSAARAAGAKGWQYVTEWPIVAPEKEGAES